MEQTAFVLWDANVTIGEIVGFVTGALCVWLLARQHVLNWPIAIVNNLTFAGVYFRAKLYGDAGLQILFAVMMAYGWVSWTRAPNAEAKAPPPRTTTATEWRWLGVATIVAFAALGLALDHLTPSPVPYADAVLVALSLAASWGQARRLVESWWIWILVDVVAVPLYITRHLYPTAVLYVIYAGLCVDGLRRWRAAAAPTTSGARTATG